MIGDCKEIMMKGYLWDPEGKQWSTDAHWPLNVMIGSTRGRDSQTKQWRNEDPRAQQFIAKAKAKAKPKERDALATRPSSRTRTAGDRDWDSWGYDDNGNWHGGYGYSTGVHWPDRRQGYGQSRGSQDQSDGQSSAPWGGNRKR